MEGEWDDRRVVATGTLTHWKKSLSCYFTSLFCECGISSAKPAHFHAAAKLITIVTRVPMSSVYLRTRALSRPLRRCVANIIRPPSNI
ncbi:hypothetical protein EVAR_6087_1 [Eumeta japonica]|uniref:Uncharacterized protein n=1 Tax=Eumeta variegata TaxID=151549 RepID=A0A4C1TDZ2_EUMVA|nr:hypothetical protein EVAR_6087_1 [Eumeta japonica]